MSIKHPAALGFLGIHAGRRNDQPVSQNETLADLFEKSGYRVRRASAIKWPLLRTLHQIIAIFLWRDVRIMIVAVFSGRSFWIARFATSLGRLTGKRVALFLHGGNLPDYSRRHRSRVERVLNRADVVIAPSEYLAAAFRPWGMNIRIIPNVLSIEEYAFHEHHNEQPKFLWMRTFHEHYDPLMAVRVLERVRRHRPDATMTMAGADHGLLDATIAEARRLGVSEYIEFPGYLSKNEKQSALATSTIFLNTNTVDNMPVSVLEAAASGLVPVATAVGGLPSLLHNGVDSILVPSGDDAAMADAVLELIANPERYTEMARQARRLAEHSSWPEVLQLWQREIFLAVPGCDLGG